MIAIAYLASVGSTSARCEVFRDAKRHITFAVPQGWTRISKEELKLLNDTLSKPGKDSLIIAAYAPDDETEESLFQRILISFERLPMQNVAYDEVISALKRSFGHQMELVVEDEGAPLKTPVVGQARLDRTRHRVVARLHPEKDGDETVHTYSAFALGKEGMATVQCIAIDDEFEKTFKTFQLAGESLQFEDGFRFKPGSGGSSNIFPRGAGRLIGAAVFLFGGGIATWFKTRRKRPKLPEKLEWADHLR